MDPAIITVESLGKKYRISHRRQAPRYTALRDVIAETAVNYARRLIPRTGRNGRHHTAVSEYEEFWALKNVTFQVTQGDLVGIIGRNGAGKSTLLKILSRITEPTEGEVRMRGRVASLLEVGTGFHPELTGRENIYLNGAILGMAREEIRRKFDEIVAFAEVERFLDTPVKRYSSGMYVRLAFAVAAHLEPEILVVDEVLAVGDALFQKKCLGKMREVSQQQGRTVLFVSHNMSAISQLTRTAIVLNRGQICFHGPTEDAISAYADASEASSAVFFDVEQQPRTWGNQAARFVSLRFDRPCPIFDFEDDFSFIARVKALKDIDRLRFSMTIFNSNGMPVGSSFGPDGPGLQRGETAEALLTMSSPRLAPGHYYCGVGVGHGNHKTGHVDYDVVMNTLNFEVSPERSAEDVMATWTSGWGSISFPPIEMQRLASLQHVES